MSEDPTKKSVSIWIEALKEGSDVAATELWDRYFHKLVKQAEKQLGNAPRRIADEEDVAVSVFQSLCAGATKGRFKRLSDRADLWKLLVAMTRMKSVDQIRRQTAKKRGSENVRGNSMLGDKGRGFDQFLGNDPTPEFMVSLADQHRELMDVLPDKSQRTVAQMRMDGYTNKEIATELRISERSVERKLRVVRESWLELIERNLE